MQPKIEALNLIDELGIVSFPIIPKDICARLNIGYCEKPFDSIDGALFLDSNFCGKIFVNSGIIEDGRKNFTCGHELGHYCLDSLQQKEFACQRSEISFSSSNLNPIELRANEFAAELLMPTHLFKKLVDGKDPDWDAIKAMSTVCCTSLVATASKFIDTTDESCVLIVSEGNKIRRFLPSENFNLIVDMDSRAISTETPTYKALNNKSVVNGYEYVNANDWLTGKQLHKHSEILEWTLPLNSYGQVLTLLYDEDGIGDIDEDNDDYQNNESEWPWEPPTFHRSRRK